MATATKTRPGTKPSGRAAREAAAKEKAARAKVKERAAKQKAKELAASRKEKEREAKRKEKEKAEKAKEKEKAAKAKEKEKAAKAKEKEKEKAAKAKLKARAARAGTQPTHADVPEAVETPVETPAEETSAEQAPAAETPADETSAAETPDTEAPLLPTVPANDKTVRPKGFVAESLGKEDAVDRSTQRATLAASYTTRDHDVIKAWAQTRNGRPADVAGTAGRRRGRGAAGVLRIEFPDGPGDDGLEAVDWSAFFATFDESDVDFLYQERVRTGDVSRFHKFVRAAG